MAALPIIDREIPHSNNLVDRMSYLLETGYMSDCSFEVGDEGKLFRCHKIILITASPVFKAMFDGLMSDENVVKILDSSPDSFEFFLRYIYTNSLKLESFELIYDFLCLSNKYMVSFPQQPCFDYLAKEGNNVCKVYELAKLLGMQQLIDGCIEMFRKETDRVLSGSEFLTAQPETIRVIFEQDELNVHNELNLFLAIEKYVNSNQCDNPQSSSLIKLALKNIRFLRILPKDFSRVVAKSDLLNQEEKLSILCNLTADDDSMEMPEGFNNIKKCRQPSEKFSEVRIDRHGELGFYKSRRDIDRFYNFVSLSFDHGKKYRNTLTYLVGIEIPTQFGNEGFCYDEELNVEVFERNYEDETLLGQKLFKQTCMFNTTVTVKFDIPIQLESSYYKIKIALKNDDGHYSVGDLTKTVEISGQKALPRVTTAKTVIRSIHLRCFD